jgi:hypothetical protein
VQRGRGGPLTGAAELCARPVQRPCSPLWAHARSGRAPLRGEAGGLGLWATAAWRSTPRHLRPVPGRGLLTSRAQYRAPRPAGFHVGGHTVGRPGHGAPREPRVAVIGPAPPGQALGFHFANRAVSGGCTGMSRARIVFVWPCSMRRGFQRLRFAPDNGFVIIVIGEEEGYRIVLQRPSIDRR